MNNNNNNNNNNNFYVSNSTIEKIHYKIAEYKRLIEKEHKKPHEIEPFKVTNEELELLELVDKRIKRCESENIHYWIMPNSQNPFTSYCHWCSMKITDYK
jgi:hypothetical protein